MMKRKLSDILYESKYTVCILGREMLVESGIDSMRNMETAYEIELKYGYSPEEVFSARFFNTRTETFYRFYQDEVLAQDKEPGAAYTALARLEELGAVKGMITRQLFNLARRAGCRNVYCLHGNIEDGNHCPRCYREYSLAYMKAAKRFPVCEDCGIPLHPGVVLLGEMVDNGLTTRAADEVSRADTLLLIGTSMRDEAAVQFLKYFHGSRVVLVHAEPHFADQEADYVFLGRTDEILPEAAEELNRRFAEKDTK